MTGREHVTGRLGVGGSNPLAPTIKIKDLTTLCASDLPLIRSTSRSREAVSWSRRDEANSWLHEAPFSNR